MLSGVGLFFAILNLRFLFFTASVHFSLNQDLFFLGLLEVLGMFFSVISVSVSVKNSMVLFLVFKLS